MSRVSTTPLFKIVPDMSRAGAENYCLCGGLGEGGGCPEGHGRIMVRRGFRLENGETGSV